VTSPQTGRRFRAGSSGIRKNLSHFDCGQMSLAPRTRVRAEVALGSEDLKWTLQQGQDNVSLRGF